MTQSELVREFLRQKADALVRGDKAFFEHGLHPDFVYVNTRGGRLDKAGYIARVSTSGDLRFASQIVSDVMVTGIGELAIATMTLHDTFVRGDEHKSFVFQSLCVFRVERSSCQWIAGQTMLPEPAP
jgi:hypothetical protein